MDSSGAQQDHQKHRKRIKIQDINTVMASTPSYSNILFSDGKTKLLDFISSMETPQALEKYLKNIANINVSLPNDSPLWPGSTPFHLAVMFTKNLMNNEKAAIKLISQLLDKGAKINVQNCCGETPLHLAFRLEQEQLVTLLLRKLERNSEEVMNLLDNENLSYLHIFCSVSGLRNNLARKLLNQKDVEDNVNVVYKGQDLASLKEGWTPLHVAFDQLQLPLVEFLLKRGADLFQADNRGYTVAYRLFGTTGRREIINLLLASKPLEEWPVAQDLGLGLTTLHVAVWLNDEEHVRRLLDSGVNIDAALGTFRDDEHLAKFSGCTALHVAIVTGRMKIMYILLEQGASTNAQTYDGKTALHLLLEFMGKKSHDYTHTFVYRTALPAIITASTDVNILDWDGKSALTYATDLLKSCLWPFVGRHGYTQEIVTDILMRIHVMKLCGIGPNEVDKTLISTRLGMHGVSIKFPPDDNKLCDELQATEAIKIGKRGLSLRSFLRETHAISMYPSLIPADRRELNNFFKSFDYRKFPYLSGLIKIQYRKAVERLTLIDAASDALKTFISFDFPDLCVDIILKYLSNMQLKTLIKAASIGDTEANIA